MGVKGLVIAGTKSGSGKTTVALGLMAAWVRRGLKVAPFKVGPDFIDPGHHACVTNAVSRNLDGWMLSQEYNISSFDAHASGADVAAVEGVMGLYDGYDGKTEAGSTAQMAKWLNLPVALTVDARSMARSAAAEVMGFQLFDPDVSFAGVIFNNVGSPRHLAYLKDALDAHVDIPCLGGIPRDTDIAIPERHLGLVTRQEHPLTGESIDRLARLMEDHLDMDGLLERLPETEPAFQKSAAASPDPDHRTVRIGVAMDSAFCFYYQDNLDILVAAGAELAFFSPVRDAGLPPDIDGLYLGGGYPEVFAESLAGNAAMRAQILEKCRNDMPIYAECGGFMYLCKNLRTVDGRVHPMTGCFPFETAMGSRLKSLGYREITLTKDTTIGAAGQTVRGHEFHYSEIISRPDAPIPTVYKVTDRVGEHPVREGYQVFKCLGGYIHLHFGGAPGIGAAFVRACREYQKERLNY